MRDRCVRRGEGLCNRQIVRFAGKIQDGRALQPDLLGLQRELNVRCLHERYMPLSLS